MKQQLLLLLDFNWIKKAAAKWTYVIQLAKELVIVCVAHVYV